MKLPPKSGALARMIRRGMHVSAERDTGGGGREAMRKAGSLEAAMQVLVCSKSAPASPFACVG